jgi:hypothetical protein
MPFERGAWRSILSENCSWTALHSCGRAAREEIPLRPIATLSLEAQERHERRERVYRDD